MPAPVVQIQLQYGTQLAWTKFRVFENTRKSWRHFWKVYTYAIILRQKRKNSVGKILSYLSFKILVYHTLVITMYNVIESLLAILRSSYQSRCYIYNWQWYSHINLLWWTCYVTLILIICKELYPVKGVTNYFLRFSFFLLASGTYISKSSYIHWYTLKCIRAQTIWFR